MKVSKKVNAVIAIFEENDFQVHTVKEGKVLCAEIETWTTGGVNMVHYLRPFTIEEFERRVEGFDIDEVIDEYRKGEAYRNAFRITESVKDFEEYHTRLKGVLEQLNAAEKPGRGK
jgi:hypothetical protein